MRTATLRSSSSLRHNTRNQNNKIRNQTCSNKNIGNHNGSIKNQSISHHAFKSTAKQVCFSLPRSSKSSHIKFASTLRLSFSASNPFSKKLYNLNNSLTRTSLYNTKKFQSTTASQSSQQQSLLLEYGQNSSKIPLGTFSLEEVLAQAEDLALQAEEYYKQERFIEAEPLLESVYSIRRTHLKDRELIIRTQLQLAFIYQNNSKIDMAIATYNELLPQMRITMGKNHKEVGAAMLNLAECVGMQNKTPEAEDIAGEAVKILAKYQNEAPELYGVALSNYAGIMAAQQRVEDALPLMLEGLALLEKALGPHNVITVRSVGSIMKAYEDLRKFKELRKFRIEWGNKIDMKQVVTPSDIEKQLPSEEAMAKLTAQWKGQVAAKEFDPVGIFKLPSVVGEQMLKWIPIMREKGEDTILFHRILLADLENAGVIEPQILEKLRKIETDEERSKSIEEYLKGLAQYDPHDAEMKRRIHMYQQQLIEEDERFEAEEKLRAQADEDYKEDTKDQVQRPTKQQLQDRVALKNDLQATADEFTGYEEWEKEHDHMLNPVGDRTEDVLTEEEAKQLDEEFYRTKSDMDPNFVDPEKEPKETDDDNEDYEDDEDEGPQAAAPKAEAASTAEEDHPSQKTAASAQKQAGQVQRQQRQAAAQEGLLAILKNLEQPQSAKKEAGNAPASNNAAPDAKKPKDEPKK